MTHEPNRERHMTYRCEQCGCHMDGKGIYHRPSDEYWCESCMDNEAERAWQRRQDDLMENGPGPTLAEQQAEARKLK